MSNIQFSCRELCQLAVGITLSLLAWNATLAQPHSGEPPPDKAKTQSESAPSEPRDPTEAIGELKDLLQAAENPPQTEKTTSIAPPKPAFPTLSVRGIILGSRRSVAMLSANESPSFMVRPRHEYLIKQDSGASVAIYVESITANGVVIELRPTKRRLILP